MTIRYLPVRLLCSFNNAHTLAAQRGTGLEANKRQSRHIARQNFMGGADAAASLSESVL